MLRWTLGYMCLFQFWFSQCVCPVVGLLGHKAVLFAIFLRNLHTVLHSGLPVCWYVSICIQMEKWIEGKNEDRCTRNNKEQAKLLRIVINLIYLLIMGFLCKYSKQMQNAIKIEINKWFTKVTLWKQTLHKLKKISKGYKIIWKVFTA